jgi:hypothetical protein
LIFRKGKFKHRKCFGFDAVVAGVWGSRTETANGGVSPQEKKLAKQAKCSAIKPHRNRNEIDGHD